MLFNLGNAISGPPTRSGSKKLPNPPIIAGITIKKIINIAWAVNIQLYNWLSAMYCTPGPDSSSLIKTEYAVPNNPENNAKIRYRVPISCALHDKYQRSVLKLIVFFVNLLHSCALFLVVKQLYCDNMSPFNVMLFVVKLLASGKLICPTKLLSCDK